MAREKKEDAPPAGAPAWMATYGDMVTLLLCFFVLLFSFSTINAVKFKEVAAALSNRLIDMGGSSGDAQSILEATGNGIVQLPDAGKYKEPPSAESSENRREAEKLQKMTSDFKTYFAENNLTSNIDVELDTQSVKITFKDSILFDKGSATIKSNAFDILDNVANELAKYSDNDIKIEGHTDTDPINTVVFPSNWELSSSRAISVLRYFIEKHAFAADRLSAEGFGEYRPIAPNDNETNKSKNRRVEIKIFSKQD